MISTSTRTIRRMGFECGGFFQSVFSTQRRKGRKGRKGNRVFLVTPLHGVTHRVVPCATAGWDGGHSLKWPAFTVTFLARSAWGWVTPRSGGTSEDRPCCFLVTPLRGVTHRVALCATAGRYGGHSSKRPAFTVTFPARSAWGWVTPRSGVTSYGITFALPLRPSRLRAFALKTPPPAQSTDPHPPPPGVSMVRRSPGRASKLTLGGSTSPSRRLRPGAPSPPPCRPQGA